MNWRSIAAVFVAVMFPANVSAESVFSKWDEASWDQGKWNCSELTASITNPPADPSNETSLTLAVAGDCVSHYKHSLDDGPYSDVVPKAADIELSNLGNGPHSLRVLGRDSSGNWQGTATVVAWAVDVTPPEAALSNLPDSLTNADGADISVGGTGVTHYRYKLDGDNY